MSERKSIDGTALAAELHELSGYYGGSFTGDGIRIALDAVKRAKTVDAVEVVRCGECKWAKPLPDARREDYFAPDCVRVCTIERAGKDASGVCAVHTCGYCAHGAKMNEASE